MAMMRHRGVPDAGSTPSPGPAAARGRTSAELTQLVRGASIGDQAAFAQLYDATAPRVYGLALRILRDPAQAEEIARESYDEVWRTSRSFDPARGSAIAWVLAITHARAASRVRSDQASTHHEEPVQGAGRPLMLVRPVTTHDGRHASVDARRVHDCLAELPRVQRDALELTYFDGCRYSEVGACLGLPQGTAAAQIRDGLIGLRKLLEDQ